MSIQFDLPEPSQQPPVAASTFTPAVQSPAEEIMAQDGCEALAALGPLSAVERVMALAGAPPAKIYAYRNRQGQLTQHHEYDRRKGSSSGSQQHVRQDSRAGRAHSSGVADDTDIADVAQSVHRRANPSPTFYVQQSPTTGDYIVQWKRKPRSLTGFTPKFSDPDDAASWAQQQYGGEQISASDVV